MKVLYDYQAFAAQRAGGVSRYFVELLREWARTGEVEAEAVAPLSISRHLTEARRAGVPGLRGRIAPAGWGPHPLLSLANRIAFAAATVGRAWDVYHPTYYAAVRPRPRYRKMVATVFDLAHARFPGLFAAGDPTADRQRRRIGESDGLVCISDFTRRELEAILGAPRARVTVIPLATRLPEVEAVPFEHPRPYWLFVGTRGGYKNFAVLAEALAREPALRETDIVCFGGGPLSPGERAAAARLGLEGRIHAAGGGDAELRGAYEKALALVYPSRYEGFGLPPLEAMSIGCPVAAADAASLPEVMGTAGVRLPPDEPEAWGAALRRLLEDGAHRRERIEAGRRRAAGFSWTATAAATARFYREVLV